MRVAPTALLAAIGLGLANPAAAADTDQLLQIAKEAYVYGYSLITTEVTRVQMTNVAKVDNEHAPMGQFINVKRYPPAGYRGVSAPNADTLYSIAWADLSEPQVFSQPDMGKRYYLMPMYDLWMTIFHSPGARTAGGSAANYLLTGPGWQGEVPAGMVQIKSATRKMLILGRTYADGSDQDYQAVNALQAQLKLTPLSAWGKPYAPKAAPVDPDPGFSMTAKPQEVILGMSTESYFNKLATLMCEDAPPAAEDGPILARMAKLGIEPCKPFVLSKLDPALQSVLQDLPATALKEIGASQPSLGSKVNGWTYTKGLGVYGDNYMKRAVVAAFGWPANVQQDAVYPYATVDSSGQKLNGAHRYTLTFAKGQTPPVNGFWSITMYQIDQGWWFVPNPLNKFTVSPRNDLQYNADGSLTLYFQHESPGKDKEANWLPAPKGDFLPMLRMYWPQDKSPSILDGSWTPPQIIRAE
ncbi:MULTISPECIES: DUF1254 domain-containing protein [unclassified Pseudomonas]|uniref:DUF1254 domain-containing protein n=1 Tax=unclassified Pseudomonas TaxID=196821 RepID=UPI00244CE5D8|nr:MULTISPECIES: DUF1254 domain-containing protein [unclassified Pseudomonas]MDG9924438.1 DUF1254 domain-containing protein [Pseudomonas sp. GD04045]MDH0035222.1 DUF1254 domain-containing protein [Pseudomonas sp. GD04019]